MDAAAVTTTNFNPSSYLNSWHLKPEKISESEVSIILVRCDKTHRVELALWLLESMPKSAVKFIEKQVDMLVLSQLHDYPNAIDPFAREWAINRRLVLDVSALTGKVLEEGMIGLEHQENLWSIHPSAKKRGYWQATHYDLKEKKMTGDTLHPSLHDLLDCGGANIHPHSIIMAPEKLERWLLICHENTKD